jgi:hypothetical protein
MSDDFTAIIIGISIGAILIALVVNILGFTYGDGYVQAYRDSKKGSIEERIKKSHPKVWIEYNAPLKEEEKPHGR